LERGSSQFSGFGSTVPVRTQNAERFVARLD
jgi:hypothetical protein